MKSTIIMFYCPACSESSELDLDTYELAPGQEQLQCPNCKQWFSVSHEYVPVEHAPAGHGPWLKPGDKIPF